MLYQAAECPKLESYQRKFFQSPKMRKVYDDHKKTIKHTEKHTKTELSKNNIHNVVWRLYEIWDTLRIEVRSSSTFLNFIENLIELSRS